MSRNAPENHKSGEREMVDGWLHGEVVCLHFEECIGYGPAGSVTNVATAVKSMWRHRRCVVVEIIQRGIENDLVVRQILCTQESDSSGNTSTVLTLCWW